ncbi:hypothetical protein LX32DRAFT_664149 [Colletotrichum zoysiae]|uniref:Nephrocystin 3-like N-terminal domain-containing protein n=1 Tax=Colletotrichum zoysiae TaxID=1216348 RepID=A0AAD9M123_9PEZI|nr:hypothetical protein LX32DRAFT_664149 [Colletotrichum zoysiae]
MDEHGMSSNTFESTTARNALVGNQFSGHTNISFHGALACLRSLAFHEINARRHDIANAHPETCDWLFDTPEFRQWMDPASLRDHNGVFWIKGKPGAGKSTLMKHAYRHCQSTMSSNCHLIAYFFNARGEALEKTPLGMLRSIVYQLLQSDNALYQHFRSDFMTQQGNRQWRQSELQEFISWAATHHLSKPFLLLVDALDECNEADVRQVVEFLESLSIHAYCAKTRLRICLSSRHYPSITIGKSVTLTVEDSLCHTEDICKYINISLRGGNTSIQDEIRRRANGIFLWVVLVVSMLNKAYDEGQIEAMQATLERVPDDLDKMFSAILTKEVTTLSETVNMFQWVLLSMRRLTSEELFAAVMEPGPSTLHTSESIQRRITTSSKGLIELRVDRYGFELVSGSKPSSDLYAQFIHLSVRDFLFRYKTLQKLDAALGPNPTTTIHGRLWARCWFSINNAVVGIALH